MEVMRPKLVWRGNSACYRRNPIGPPGTSGSGYEEDYEFDYDGNESSESDMYTESVVIQESKGTGGFKARLCVASFYYGPIIGTGGSTLRRLEDETRAQIKVPRQKEEGDIVILGQTKKSVRAACRKINIIVDDIRSKQIPTHFLSLPIVNEEIKEKFIRFKEKILHQHEDRLGIDESIFQNPNKLHLTIGMLVLDAKDRRDFAANMLKKADKEIIQPITLRKPLVVRMRGIEFMNDDPSEVNVLYAKMERNDDLQLFADALYEYFGKPGLLRKQYEHVKLHATLMNTSFRSSEEYQDKRTFDARPIMEVFRDYDFGECSIDSVHLSIRYTGGDESYYSSTASVSFVKERSQE